MYLAGSAAARARLTGLLGTAAQVSRKITIVQELVRIFLIEYFVYSMKERAACRLAMSTCARPYGNVIVIVALLAR